MAPRRVGFPAAVALAALAGCGGDVPAIAVAPSHASLFGGVTLAITGDSSIVTGEKGITVGGLRAFREGIMPRSCAALAACPPATIQVTIQGAPAPGPADVLVLDGGGRAIGRGTVTFDPP